MVDFTTLTSSTSDNLKCFVCKNYLSYFPIFLCSNHRSVCDRCTIPEGLTVYRNYAFEEICQHIKFPCRFKNEGCSEQILPKNIPEHEEDCLFRTIECVINKPEKCQWQGSLPDLLKHCEKQHSDLFLKNHEFEMDPTDAEERDNLIKFEDNLLVFRRNYNPQNQKITFRLFFSKYETNCKIFSYQLSVTNDNLSLICNFKTSIFLNEVCLKSLHNDNKPDMFLVKLKLPEKKNATIQDNNLNSEMLKFLKCAECSLIIKPPIFHCISELRPICSSCEGSHSKSCDSCTSIYGEAFYGNNAFEEIMDRYIEYPCKFNINGCTFSSTHKFLKKHQLSCVYEDSDCPMSDLEKECPWKGYKKDLYSHILDDHADCIHTSSEHIYELPPEEKINMSFMRFSSHLFRLSYIFEDKEERYKWWLEKIGDFDTKYRFEVEIVDDALGLRFLVGNRCFDLRDKNNGDFCYMRKDQVRCLKEENLRFKVRILKL